MQMNSTMTMQLGNQFGDVRLEAKDLTRMRKAFAGIHVSSRHVTYNRLHLEDGQAFMTDGARLHTIPIRYRAPLGVDLSLEQVRRAWRDPKTLWFRPTPPIDSFLPWNEMVPKADIGVLCDLDVWLPALESIRGWGWSRFTFYRDEVVIEPISSTNGDMQVGLSHLMYKGKKIVEVQERVFNPQYIYDVFHNACELGDSRVFLCLLSQNRTAPLLCRGNSSSLLALVVPRK